MTATSSPAPLAPDTPPPTRARGTTGRDWAGRLLAPLVFSLLVLAGWQLIVALADLRETILPRPTVIASHIYDQRSLLLDNAWVTLKEILIGFMLAFAVGITLAILITTSRLIERAIYPWMIASQMVPIVAIAPLLVLWFGFDLTPKVLVVALVSFFPLAVNSVDGLRAPPREMIDLMRTLGAGRLRIFRVVQIPAALPFVFSGAKVAIAFATLGAVFGEWVGASDGLGYLILTLNNQSATADVFAAVFVLSMLGIALFGLVSLLERVLLAWRFAGRG